MPVVNPPDENELTWRRVLWEQVKAKVEAMPPEVRSSTLVTSAPPGALLGESDQRSPRPKYARVVIVARARQNVAQRGIGDIENESFSVLERSLNTSYGYLLAEEVEVVLKSFNPADRDRWDDLLQGWVLEVVNDPAVVSIDPLVYASYQGSEYGYEDDKQIVLHTAKLRVTGYRKWVHSARREAELIEAIRINIGAP